MTEGDKEDQARIEAAIDRIGHIGDMMRLEAFLLEMRDLIGATHLLYHWLNSEGALVGAGTYSDAWRDLYVENGYQMVDPVARAVANGFQPIEWAKLDWSAKRARELWADAQAHGIGDHGLSIPIHGPAGQRAHLSVTLVGDQEEWESFLDRHMRGLILFGHYVNGKVLELTQEQIDAAGVILSPREIEALTCLARGESRAQAAARIGISEHTLRVYIETARHKLGAANTASTIAKAMKLGHITV